MSFIQVTFGDSQQSMSDFYIAHPDVRCDVIVVDGGHYDDVPAADIKNFRQFVDVTEQHIVLIDDFPTHTPWAVAVEIGWRDAELAGHVTTIKQCHDMIDITKVPDKADGEMEKGLTIGLYV